MTRADGCGLDIFVDWPEFWSHDRRVAEWLFEPVIVRGRSHVIYAAHKAGKSLLTLWLATSLTRGHEPVLILYLDFEMGEDDLYERLDEMGYGPDSDLERLRYALLPSLPPLDQPEGARALLAIVDREQAAHPDHHLCVVFDTYSRVVSGPDNDADTTRAFHRHTGLGLKQRGVTWLRLDHAGKDVARGQRGSSAKGDDVDVVWSLRRGDDGLLLKRDASRMSWVPETVALTRRDGPLRFIVADRGWPAGTKDTAELLDNLEVPADCGERKAGAALREHGHQVANAVVRAAQKYRREGVR
jgi:hypothetical protein